MRDFRDAKAMARALRDALKTKAIETTHTEALELIAKAFGYENSNILSAKIEEAEPSASAKEPGSDDGSPSVPAMLTLEVDHRAKNILSVVQAIAHQTKASSVQEFIARFDERIRSLKASHDLLVKTKWRNIPLAELVRAQLAHFGPILDSRIIGARTAQAVRHAQSSPSRRYHPRAASGFNDRCPSGPHVDMPRIVRESLVLARIGGQLVDRHANCLVAGAPGLRQHGHRGDGEVHCRR
jgi:HWE histidine kinase/Glyoxalase superfamily protein